MFCLKQTISFSKQIQQAPPTCAHTRTKENHSKCLQERKQNCIMDISYKLRLMLAIWLQLICNWFNFQKLTRKRIQYLSSNTVLSNTNAARIGTLLSSSSKYQFLLRLSISKKKFSTCLLWGFPEFGDDSRITTKPKASWQQPYK